MLAQASHLSEQVGVLGTLGRSTEKAWREETESRWFVRCVFLANAFSCVIVSHVLGNLSLSELSSSLNPTVRIAHHLECCMVGQDRYTLSAFYFFSNFRASAQLSWTLSVPGTGMRTLLSCTNLPP